MVTSRPTLVSLHAHAERHRGLWGIQWPWRMGNYDALMGMTEILRVDEADVDVVDRGEWEGR